MKVYPTMGFPYANKFKIGEIAETKCTMNKVFFQSGLTHAQTNPKREQNNQRIEGKQRPNTERVNKQIKLWIKRRIDRDQARKDYKR